MNSTFTISFYYNFSKQVIKKLEILSTTLFFSEIDEKRFFVLNNRYILIPSCVKFEKTETYLTFFLDSNDFIENLTFKNFIFSITQLSKRGFDKNFKKRLILKGLGFKANVNSSLSCLELKLGFSHLIQMPIPSHISVKVDKNIITVEGLDKNKVGDFVYKIRSLKTPDVYKGKGFWYKNEIKTLKEVKKT